ncbi:MAG: pilus assembly protein PilM [Deltaproteobacteria bacterium]
MADLFVGIDIGASFTKAVVLEKKLKASLLHSAIFPTQYGLSSQGEKTFDAVKLVEGLTTMMPLARFREASVAVSLPESSITVLSVLLPLMSVKELSFAAINEAKQKMIPTSGPHHIFECLFLGERKIEEVTKYEVLVVRTERREVEKIIGGLQAVLITPDLITPEPFVLSSIVPPAAWKKDEDIAFIDIGAASLNITVCRENNLAFMRSIAYGTDDIIANLSEKLEIPKERAAKLINEEKGIPEVEFNLNDKVALAEEIMKQKYEAGLTENTSAAPEVNMLELRMHWQPHIERILQELRRSLSFYKDQSRGRRIERMYFLGGGCRIPNLVTTFSKYIGGQCEMINPFAELKPEAKGPADVAASVIFASAAGMAVSLLHKQGPKTPQHTVNFLPKEFKRRHANRLVNIGFYFLMSLLILGLGGFVLTALIANVLARENIKKLDFQIESFQKKQKELVALVDLEKNLKQKKAKIASLRAAQADFPSLFRRLSGALLPGMLLTRAEFSSGKLTLSGRVYADYESGVEKLDTLKKRMADEGFQDIKATPLMLETISSPTGETEKKWRNFDITAKAAAKK